MINKRSVAKPRLYFAAPLFSDAEREFNSALAKRLRPMFDVYLPQEDGGLVAEMVKQGIEISQAFSTVVKFDVLEVQKCDVLLIILDGRTVDEGAAFELGYANALDKFCVGLQTDPRRLIASRNNPMIDCALESIFTDVDALLAWAGSFHSSFGRGCEHDGKTSRLSARSTINRCS